MNFETIPEKIELGELYLDAEKIPLDKREEFSQQYVGPDALREKLNVLSQSMVLLAPYGGGKTAARLYIESILKNLQTKNLKQSHLFSDEVKHTPFVITYNNFSRLVKDFPEVTLTAHTQALLPHCAEAVLKLIQARSADFLKLTERQRDWFWAFLEQYLLGELLTYRLPTQDVLYGDWKRNPARPRAFHTETPLAHILVMLLTHLRQLKIQKLFILVDGIDGVLETQTESSMATLIAPLLNTTTILSLPDITWKMFLPVELEATVSESSGYRTGRLDLIPIQWDADTLLEFFLARFPDKDLSPYFAFNNNAYSEELVVLALRYKRFGAPRALLKLMTELVELINIGNLIQIEQWQKFIQSHHSELHPEENQHQTAIFAVINAYREVKGTAFCVTVFDQHYLVTCAHVIKTLNKRKGAKIDLYPFAPKVEIITAHLRLNCSRKKGLRGSKRENWQATQRENWAASEDIAILQPSSELLADLENDAIELSQSNYSDCGIQEAFWCWGYEKTRKLRGHRLENISVGRQVGQGFREILLPSGVSITPGMSGSPLFDSQGELVGMIQASYGYEAGYIIPRQIIYETIKGL